MSGLNTILYNITVAHLKSESHPGTWHYVVL